MASACAAGSVPTTARVNRKSKATAGSMIFEIGTPPWAKERVSRALSCLLPTASAMLGIESRVAQPMLDGQELIDGAVPGQAAVAADDAAAREDGAGGVMGVRIRQHVDALDDDDLVLEGPSVGRGIVEGLQRAVRGP